MGDGVVFCSDKIKHIEKIMPEELIFSTAGDLKQKWDRIDMPTHVNLNTTPWTHSGDRWDQARFNFQRKLRTKEFSYETRVKQLLEFIDRYYG